MNHLTIVFLLAGLFCTTQVLSQTQWSKYTGNPVLREGSPSSWDDMGIPFCWIQPDVGGMRMWYAGAKIGGSGKIGLATSSDSGITWVKDTVNNPVLSVGPPGSWDGGEIFSPIVLKLDTTYHMWYSASNTAPYFNGTPRVGHATSPDGISWTKDLANPVLNVGPPGSWDGSWVYPRTVALIGGGSIDSLRMWYTGNDGTQQRIGVANSTDRGRTWIKDPLNPRFVTEQTWEGGFVQNPFVILGDTCKMYYNGHPATNTYKIGYATSTDMGLTWTRPYTTFILDTGPFGSWDGRWVWAPFVWFIGTLPSGDLIYRMWYSGFDGNYFRVGVAHDTVVITSVRGILGEQPAAFSLEQNYPNPFNPTTNIEFRIANFEFVSLKIYNILGQEVATLVNEELKPGSYEVTWDPSGQASGVYFYRLQAGQFKDAKRLMLVR